MAKTVPVYVSVNADNNTLTEQPKSTAADGLKEMWIRPGMLNYLLENWQKYVVIDGEFKRTSDSFADLSVDHLLHVIEMQTEQIASATATIDKMDDKLTTANTTITQLQGMAGSLTGQVAKANQTIDQLQALTGQLTGQVAKLQVAQTATTTE